MSCYWVVESFSLQQEKNDTNHWTITDRVTAFVRIWQLRQKGCVPCLRYVMGWVKITSGSSTTVGKSLPPEGRARFFAPFRSMQLIPQTMSFATFSSLFWGLFFTFISRFPIRMLTAEKRSSCSLSAGFPSSNHDLKEWLNWALQWKQLEELVIRMWNNHYNVLRWNDKPVSNNFNWYIHFLHSFFLGFPGHFKDKIPFIKWMQIEWTPLSLWNLTKTNVVLFPSLP